MKRKRTEEEDVSLDSLLDTMTNVVAILVILLIVTQLGVSEAVKRISAANPVDPAKIEAAKKSVKKRKNRLETLRALAGAAPESREQVEFKLKNTKSEIERVVPALEKLEQESRQLQLMAAAQTEQKSKQKDLDKINEEIRLKMTAIQKVEAQLEQIPIRDAVETKVVNLPNPRPAPKGAKPFLMVIQNERVFPLDLEKFRQMAKLKARQVIERAKLNRDPKKGIDPERFLNLFNKQKLRDPYFEVTMKANGELPVLVFYPQPKKGIGMTLLTKKSGPFWKTMATINPEQFYISFLVWSESFETYLTMRNVCSQFNLAAGWAPQNTTRPLERGLGGDLRFGPPPPPKPMPNNQSPKPKTPPKPMPVDTID